MQGDESPADVVQRSRTPLQGPVCQALHLLSFIFLSLVILDVICVNLFLLVTGSTCRLFGDSDDLIKRDGDASGPFVRSVTLLPLLFLVVGS